VRNFVLSSFRKKFLVDICNIIRFVQTFLFCQILERISVLTFAVQYHSICANFVVQLLKMEDVSVGLWVGQYG